MSHRWSAFILPQLRLLKTDSWLADDGCSFLLPGSGCYLGSSLFELWPAWHRAGLCVSTSCWGKYLLLIKWNEFAIYLVHVYKTASVGLTRGPGRQTALFICFHPTGVRLVLCISRLTIDEWGNGYRSISCFCPSSTRSPLLLRCQCTYSGYSLEDFRRNHSRINWLLPNLEWTTTWK